MKSEILAARLHFAPEAGQIWLDTQRMILVHVETMGSLRQELIETLGRDRARGVVTRMGYASGKRDAEFARRLMPDATDSELLALGPQLHTLEGIVNVSIVALEIDIQRGNFSGDFIWENSFEAEVHAAAFGIEAEPACWMQVGYASGYCSELMGQSTLCREVECVAKGDSRCRIIGKLEVEWGDAERDMKYLRPDPVADRLLELQSQVERLRYSVQEGQHSLELVGTAPAFNAAFELIRKAAASQVTVLLLGETGVGKELFGRHLHQQSPRAKAPFIAVNCAAIPEDLIESELFGVEKGAFTGANQSRPGRFERAHGGTLFLDEVGELSPGAQAKLLRVIQEGEFERIGDTTTRKVNVRLICATNKNLREAVSDGVFRADLFYRLNVYPVLVPPLRDRASDIPLLVTRFIDKHSARHDKKITGITPRAMDALIHYEWPGNIRELENIIERGVILTASGEAIEATNLFSPLQPASLRPIAPVNRAGRSEVEALVEVLLREHIALDDLETQLLDAAVQRSEGNLSSAARLLGLTRPQLAYRLKKQVQMK
ncbi:MAG: sigma-54-dependent Fis family transcriptional regulator [Gammaproteobacteria bacterium]|nr:sigma-54-dependent Fis family transcriptional regulator [Gammaproteobacteria bacterium]